MPKKYRVYTQEQKADALAAYASTGNAKGTAKKMGVPGSTMRDWIADPEKAAPAAKREAAKRDLLKELDTARWAYLDRLSDPAVVNQERGYYAAQTFKTLNEAHQLLSGGPTARFSLADYLRGAGFGKADSLEGEFKEVPAAVTGGTT